jgi:HK97 family phage prohead protease
MRNPIFDRMARVTFSVSKESRTIKGLAVPFGVVGDNGFGRFRFSRGTLAWSKVKYLDQHNWSQAVGTVKFEETDDGLVMSAKIAPGPRGDQILALTEPDPETGEAVYDGLSIGLADDAEFEQAEDGVFDCLGATVLEVSGTPIPAFQDAQVTSVAASAVPNRKGADMPKGNTAEATAEATTAEATTAAAATEAGVNGFSGAALSAADITTAVTAGVTAALTEFSGEPGPVRKPAAGRPLGFQVNEESLYRFDGIRGQHDFSEDLIRGLGLGRDGARDPEAYQRVLQYMGGALGPRFVTKSDTSAVNPTGYRPDMYVDEQRFSTPLRDAFYKGALTDSTPFTFPKFNAASGLVGDHTEGTEPTAGTFSTANGGTVTPAPVSGKVHITREVADQGGNPQVSALIWSKIQYEYLKAMELKIAAMLDAASPAELGAAIAAGAADIAGLADPIEDAIAGLNFVAGGNRYSITATHIDLYLALKGLRDGQDRPYYPVIGATNANGSTVAGFKSLDVAGTRFDPVWSLGATAGSGGKSYLADPGSVWFWHSAPQRLDRLQEDVEGYDLGVWGYQAGVISDLTGVKKITYDPTV